MAMFVSEGEKARARPPASQSARMTVAWRCDAPWFCLGKEPVPRLRGDLANSSPAGYGAALPTVYSNLLISPA